MENNWRVHGILREIHAYRLEQELREHLVLLLGMEDERIAKQVLTRGISKKKEEWKTACYVVGNCAECSAGDDDILMKKSNNS